jgi:mono/diheme cytochrome c family protein
MTTRTFIGVLVFFFIAILVIAIALGEPDRMETFEDSTLARSVENGAELFQGNCDRCHGIQGKGIVGVAPPLNSFDFFTTRMEEVGYSGSLRSYIESTLEAGRPVKSAEWPEAMPTWGQAYGGPLRQDQIEDLTNYILNWEAAALARGPEETREPVEVSDDPIERGMGQFVNSGCGGCHMIEGLEGAVGQVGPDLTNIATVAGTRVDGQSPEEYIRTSILNPGAYIVEQCPPGPCANVMPANYGETLATQALDDIVAYLLTLE